MIEIPLLLDTPINPDFNTHDKAIAFETMRQRNRIVTGILRGTHEIDELLENLLDQGDDPDEYIEYGVLAIERVMRDPHLLNQ